MRALASRVQERSRQARGCCHASDLDSRRSAHHRPRWPVRLQLRPKYRRPGRRDGRAPLVGTWLLDTDADDPTNPPSLASFGADGIYTEVDADGTVGMGSWESTGPNTAELTFHGLGSEEGEFFGMITVRAENEVAADGQSLTATYTLEFTGPDGTGTGQYGPGNVTGTKVVVEPMGTPVGPISGLFEEVGTPEATPGA